MSINLYVKVGRANAHCVGTFPDAVAADGAQAAKSAELRASGVAPERVEFSRETIGAAVAKKLKGK
jgi:hypothetical protein